MIRTVIFADQDLSLKRVLFSQFYASEKVYGLGMKITNHKGALRYSKQ